MPDSSPKAVEAYYRALKEPARSTLQKVRAAILAAAPHAFEVIAYGQPTFKEGPGHGLVAIAAFKNHCSFFPMSNSILDRFADELGDMRTSIGTLQFPHDKPPSAALVKKIVKARIAQDKANKAERDAKKAAGKAKSSSSDLPKLAAPAQRALTGAGLTSLAKLSKKTEAEVAALHGMGPNALTKLKAALKAAGTSFAKR